ncbi:DUF3622 domain-containing protein [Arenicella sp.]|nr:DUF3622 domain-containing protein [Arenicella sp.]
MERPLMAKNNKYQINTQKNDSSWSAQITRQVSSKKTKVTKQQSDFASETEAKEWAETELKQLLATQVSSNQRHDKNRKQNTKIAQQRSARRAVKTALAKAEKARKPEDQQQTSDVVSGTDPETDYNFDEF